MKGLLNLNKARVGFYAMRITLAKIVDSKYINTLREVKGGMRSTASYMVKFDCLHPGELISYFNRNKSQSLKSLD